MGRRIRWLFSAAPFEPMVADRDGLKIRIEPQCSRCGYDLRLLPDTGRCPECGNGYDRISRYVDIKRPIGGTAVLALPTALALAALLLTGFAQVVNLPPLLVIGPMFAGVMIMVGNGWALGSFLQWHVVRRRAAERVEGTFPGRKRKKSGRTLGLMLSVFLYLLLLAASIAVIVSAVTLVRFLKFI